MSGQITKYVDPAMYQAEKILASEGPRVYLLSMNADPLGSIAACAKMYKGEVVRSLSDVTHAERRYYLDEMQKTKLKMPLESVQMHFMIEGVTRAFTHQMVRQRTAAYAQESMRFAVKDGLDDAVALPPSLAATTGELGDPEITVDEETWNRASLDERMRAIWEGALEQVDASYTTLIAMGMPAEDARGLLPTNVLTRIHYITNLRGLLDHAGNRLCTQAQFEWRLVFAQISQAIRDYNPYASQAVSASDRELSVELMNIGDADAWQFQEISRLLKPVCYQTGHCAFLADFDRHCKIRDRVEANHAIGRPSSEWHKEHDHTDIEIVPAAGVVREKDHPTFIGPIQPAEWLLDAEAARPERKSR